MFTLDFALDARSRGEFLRAMQHRMDVLGETPKRTVIASAAWLMVALRSRTKKGKVSRAKVTYSRSARKRERLGYGGSKLFYAHRFDKEGNPVKRRIFANSIAEARTSKLAFIRNRGLAKSSWNFALRGINRKGAKVDPNAEKVLSQQNCVTVEQKASTGDYTITVDNKLDYIGKVATRAVVRASIAAVVARTNGWVRRRLYDKGVL